MTPPSDNSLIFDIVNHLQSLVNFSTRLAVWLYRKNDITSIV